VEAGRYPDGGETDSLRSIQWTIPVKDGTKYKRNWETLDSVHWTIQYEKEYSKFPARERKLV
jgi:hypothetical protein